MKLVMSMGASAVAFARKSTVIALRQTKFKAATSADMVLKSKLPFCKSCNTLLYACSSDSPPIPSAKSLAFVKTKAMPIQASTLKVSFFSFSI